MDDLNVEDTLSHAKKVLNAHREWLKRKNSSVSPVVEKGKHPNEEETIRYSNGPSTHKFNATSTPFRPRSGRITPLDVSVKKGWEEDETPALMQSDNTSIMQNGRGHEVDEGHNVSLHGQTHRRKRKSRGTIVPITSSNDNKLDPPSIRSNGIFIGSTDDEPNGSENLHNSSLVFSVQSLDAIESEVRLRETIAHIQADGEHDTDKVTASQKETRQQLRESKTSKTSLLSTSTATIVSVEPATTDRLQDRSYSSITSNSLIQQRNNSNPMPTIVKPQSASNRSNRTSSSSVIVVQPTRKKSSIKAQPIHVVEPGKLVSPVKVHRSVSQQSNYSDITIEDAEDWIPPSDILLSPSQRDMNQSQDDNTQKTNDINLTDALGTYPTQYAMKRSNQQQSEDDLLECVHEMPTQKERRSLNSRRLVSRSIISSSSRSKSDIGMIEEEVDLAHECQVEESQIEKVSSDSESHLNQDGSHAIVVSDIANESVVPSTSPSMIKKPQPREKLPPLSIEQNSLTKDATKIDKAINKETNPKENTDKENEKPVVSITVQNGEENQSPKPLLRVRSVASLHSPVELKFKKKRERAPPDYSIHSQTSTLPPPCPQYGLQQPPPDEVINKPVFRSAPIAHEAVITHSNESIIRTAFTGNSGYDDNVSQIIDSLWQMKTTPTSLEPIRSKGPSKLHEAARNGNLRKLQALIMKGHHVDETDNEGRTPLMYCILPNGGTQLHCVDYLMRNGANLDHQTSEGFTALHLASYQGAVSLMELLIMNGANPDVKDVDGRLPLHWSTHPGSIKPIDLLFKHSANDVHAIDNSDMTLLMWACYNGNVTVAKYLMDKGADPEEKDCEGKTAMHWACEKCDINCLQLLLMSDMTYFKDHKGCTVMHIAAQSGFVRGVQHILKKRLEAVHDTDKEGRTPLHHAAATDKVDICYLLLNKGAEATQKDNHGLTALEYGKRESNEYVVALFTCHAKSMAEFTRRERIRRNDSRRLTTKPHDLLSDDDITAESLQSHDYDTISIATTVASSKFSDDSECMKEASLGGYLGLFSCKNHQKITEKELNDPPCHYYFWIASGELCWSRSNSKNHKITSKVTKLEEGPSVLVKSRPDYSPFDLHQYAFRLWLRDHPIDLLAYSSDSYYMWTVCINMLISGRSQSPETTIGTNDYELDNDGESDCVSGRVDVSDGKSRTDTEAENEGLKKGLELM